MAATLTDIANKLLQEFLRGNPFYTKSGDDCYMPFDEIRVVRTDSGVTVEFWFNGVCMAQQPVPAQLANAGESVTLTGIEGRQKISYHPT